MSPSSRKCHLIDCKIQLGGQYIDRVNHTTFLGVIIEDTLTWNLHVNNICNKVSKSMGILYRARQVLYGQTLLTLYNALIKPHFMYCITVWGNTCKTYLHKLHLMQKKIIRIISYSQFHVHTAPLLQKFDILNIYQLNQYFVGLFIYRSLHHELATSLCNMFVRNVNARNSFNLRSKYYKKKISQQSIKIAGPKIWNNFPKECKISNSINSFKSVLKRFLTKLDDA
jgi:hypothetical protein